MPICTVVRWWRSTLVDTTPHLLPPPRSPRGRTGRSGAIILALTALIAASEASAITVRLNCGSTEAHVMADGRTFIADQAYGAGNSVGFTAGWADHSGIPLGGTPDQPLYFQSRVNWAYRIDGVIPGGEYLVEMHFSDHRVHGPGIRVFDVDVDGSEVISNIDVIDEAGTNRYALRHRFTYTATGTSMVITGVPNQNDPFLCALSVVDRTADTIAPAPPDWVTAFGGLEQNQLHWNDVSSLDAAGFRVYRATSAGGPFTRIGRDPIRIVRHFDRNTSIGTEYFYYVTAVDVYGNESVPSDTVSATARSRNDSVLPVYQILIDQADWDVINANPQGDATVPATLFVGTDNWDVQVRYRGGSTRTYAKKSWKIKFDAPVFGGRDILNLNASMPDMTLLREDSAYDFLKDADVKSPIADHVKLFVNGNDFGVYVDLEDLDAQFIDRAGLPPGGNLYRCYDNLALLDDPADYPLVYEKKTNEDGDYTDLIAFIELINTTPLAQYYRDILPVFDLEAFHRYLAANALLGNRDFGADDYYLYHDLVGDRWYWLPWDYNETWGLTVNWVDEIDADGSLYPGSINVLIQKLRARAHFRYRHLQQIQRWMDTIFDPAYRHDEFQARHDLIADPGRLDWYKWQWEDNARFDAGVAELDTYVTLRRDFIESTLPAQVPAPELVINELMADNNGIILDDAGEPADWIELFNPTAVPLSLAGHYLSDDTDDLRKWAFPDTTIAPGGYLLVWCDGDTLQGEMHASFALNAGGEWVGVFKPDAEFNDPLDTFTFPDAIANVSYGRFPDASYSWRHLPTPTPGASNVETGNIIPQFSNTGNEPALPTEADSVVVTTEIWDDTGIVGASLWADVGAGFESLPLTDDGAFPDELASDGVYSGLILPQTSGTVVHYYVEATDDSLATATDPDLAPVETFFYEIDQVLPDVVINEFLAANTTTLPDEWGEYDDWVELYNSGVDSIPLTGMYLSDDLLDTRKWQFPDTTLAPGDYLLVWCDASTIQGPLHTSFRLSASGEELGLFESDLRGNVPVDTLSFGPQVDDDSFGRLPDGSDNWVVFLTPTPGAANEIISVDASTSPPVMYLGQARPNPVMGRARLTFGVPSAGTVHLDLFDVMGRRVAAVIDGRRFEPGHHRVEWNGRDARGNAVAPGVYFFRLAVDRSSLTRKIVVSR